MANDPVDDIDGLASAADVSKEETRAELKAVLRAFANADAVRSTDLSGRTRIMVGQSLYRKDTENVSVDNGETVIHDIAGNHWVRISFDGVGIHAAGDFEDRDDYDAEESPRENGMLFVYLSVDWTRVSISTANGGFCVEFHVMAPDTSAHTYKVAIFPESASSNTLTRRQFTLEEIG